MCSEFRQEGDVIGEGTYGKVFCAFDLRAAADSDSHGPVVNQLVALKKMKVRENDDYPVPALREVRLLQTLSHPNIVKLLGIAYKSKSVKTHGMMSRGSWQAAMMTAATGISI